MLDHCLHCIGKVGKSVFVGLARIGLDQLKKAPSLDFQDLRRCPLFPPDLAEAEQSFKAGADCHQQADDHGQNVEARCELGIGNVHADQGWYGGAPDDYSAA